MTPQSINKIIGFESIFFSVRALASGLPAGALASYAVYHIVMLAGTKVVFTFPFSSIVYSAAGVFALTFIVTRLTARKAQE